MQLKERQLRSRKLSSTPSLVFPCFVGGSVLLGQPEKDRNEYSIKSRIK